MPFSCDVNLDAMMPPNMMNVPPQMVPPPHNMNMNMPMPSMYWFNLVTSFIWLFSVNFIQSITNKQMIHSTFQLFRPNDATASDPP